MDKGCLIRSSLFFTKDRMTEQDNFIEKAVFVGVIKQNEDEQKVIEYLDELEFLAETAGAVTDKRFIQKVDKPNPKTYIGSGKLEELKAYIKEQNISLVIFDDELTPSQLRNIERRTRMQDS